MNNSLPPPSLELSIPSELGYEKVARDAVGAFARRLGFEGERVEDLKTALSEACINAIEHGNAQNPGLRIDVMCVCENERLTIEICDQGLKIYTGHRVPGIESKLQGQAPARGMGLLLIAQLVDEFGFEAGPTGGNVFRLALYRQSAAPTS